MTLQSVDQAFAQLAEAVEYLEKPGTAELLSGDEFARVQALLIRAAPKSGDLPRSLVQALARRVQQSYDAIRVQAETAVADSVESIKRKIESREAELVAAHSALDQAVARATELEAQIAKPAPQPEPEPEPVTDRSYLDQIASPLAG